MYALSTDDHQRASEVVSEHQLTYPVIYGVNGPQLAQAWGSYYEARRDILHATGFIIGADKRVRSATYSTGPVGRLVAGDVLGFIQFVRKQEG
ncbi:MAG: hypothetical protein Tsb0020_01130 [Haliangiales bacterium]